MSGVITLGVVSDTHLYRKPVPAELLRALEGVDMILHAGDLVEMAVLAALESLAPTHAVHGNMDLGDARKALPAKRIVEVGAHRLGLIHGSGAPDGIIHRLRPEFEEVEVIVFGHTHRPFNSEEEGVLFFNPGSPTDKMFAPFRSLGVLELGERVRGRIVALE